MEGVTKRALISDIAKTFDALGWFSPVIIKAKKLLQSLWAKKVEWDDLVPESVLKEWSQWRIDLNVLTDHHIPRCYHPKHINVGSMQLHEFSDASERAYAGVVYVRSDWKLPGNIKDKGSTYKEAKYSTSGTLWSTVIITDITSLQGGPKCTHGRCIRLDGCHIVLNWIQGNPHRFKTYVGNRVSQIMDLVPPDHWRHVSGVENPGDCASHGLSPPDILTHHLWWNGPDWLKCNQNQWPSQLIPKLDSHLEELELCSLVSNTTIDIEPLVTLWVGQNGNRNSLIL